MIKRLFKRDLLVVDIKYLPIEYQELTLDELRLRLEKELKRDILILDSSRINYYSGNSQGCYILK